MIKHIPGEPILFCGSASGVYIPQRFAQEVKREFVANVTDEDWTTLEAGPPHEWYWETWSNVQDNAVVTIPGESKTYRLYQDGDLWLLPEDYDGPIIEN